METVDMLKKIKNASDEKQFFLIIKMKKRKDDDATIGTIRTWETSVDLEPIPKGKQINFATILTQPDNPSCLIINVGEIAKHILIDPKSDYINSEIKGKTGLSLRQIQYYTTENIIIPKQKGSGRGSFHKYSLSNLFEYFLIRELWSYGVTIQKIRTIFEGIKRLS